MKRRRKRRSFWLDVDGKPVHVLTGGADVSELTERDFEALRAMARAGAALAAKRAKEVK